MAPPAIPETRTKTMVSLSSLAILLSWTSAFGTPPLERLEQQPGTAQEDQRPLPEALESDDECLVPGLSDGPACAANAMQRRALKAAASQDHGSNTTGSCANFGCSGFDSRHTCQCNTKCVRYNNCCPDYAALCSSPSSTSQGSHSCASYGCSGYVRSHTCQCNSACSSHGDCCHDFDTKCSTSHSQEHQYYKLNWEAHGHSFFDGFTFLNGDGNHGSAHYVEKAEALREGLVQAHSTHAIIRPGKSDPVYKYKRHTTKIGTTRSWKYFLAAMRFSHVPFGCGVWPAFFTLSPNADWPAGGEVDILEYVNDEKSKTSLHTGQSCRLNSREVNKFGAMPDRNEMGYDCVTKYPDRLGCAPNKWMRSGAGWAGSPGVLVLERTPEFIKIFYIPEGAIPGDLHGNAPRPETWNRFLLSYYPLAASGCSSSCFQAQQLVLDIGFCGDWASKVWGDSPSCQRMAWRCRPVDPLHEYNPDQDCCTQFIWDPEKVHGTDQYLARQAFWNISWIKVFQPGR